MRQPSPNEGFSGKGDNNSVERELTEGEIAAARKAAVSGNAKELLCIWCGVLLLLAVIAISPALVGNRIDRFWGPLLQVGFEGGANPLYTLLLAWFFGSCLVIVMIAVGEIISAAWEWDSGMRLTSRNKQVVAVRYGREEERRIAFRKWKVFSHRPLSRWLSLIAGIYFSLEAIRTGVPVSGVFGILLGAVCVVRLYAFAYSVRFKDRTMKPAQMIVFERAIIIGTSLIKKRNARVSASGQSSHFSLRINLPNCTLSLPIPDWGLERVPAWMRGETDE